MTAIRASTSSVAALGVAAVAGTAAGALTAHLQGVFPAAWSTIANSGAVWTVVAFALAAALGRTRATAVTAGLLVLLGEVAGYYIYLAARGLPATETEQVLWTMAALWIGPLVGIAAFAARWGTAVQRMAALTGLAGVLAGEGGHLIRLAGLPKPGWVEVVLAAVLATEALTSGRVPVRMRAAALGLGAATAAAVYLAYGLPLFG
ncbi:MAG: hypothetical protein QOC66_2756 [Pseudonocardiales bacterium]|jgi:hypothetical protein|nr:hypothetical protein [Pseudonocardiales bacterium]